MTPTTPTEAPATVQGKTITATAHYTLTAAGQKAAVIAGKNAAVRQTITGEIPIEFLDLCKILADGSVVADLTGTIQINDDGTRSPWYTGASYDAEQDAPAESIVDLFTRIRAGLTAARARVKAEDEQAKDLEKRNGEVNRVAAESAYRAFLANPAARATDYAGVRNAVDCLSPSDWWPSESTCPEFAAEIARRNAADRAAAKQAAESLAAAKAAALRAWLAEYGTDDQAERFDAGVLPAEEIETAMADHVFEPLEANGKHPGFSHYAQLTAAEVRNAVDCDERYEDTEAQFRSVSPTGLGAAQWKQLKAMRAACPAATITPRLHEGTLDSDDVAWGVVECMGALATATVAGVELRREYAL